MVYIYIYIMIIIIMYYYFFLNINIYIYDYYYDYMKNIMNCNQEVCIEWSNDLISSPTILRSIG